MGRTLPGHDDEVPAARRDTVWTSALTRVVGSDPLTTHSSVPGGRPEPHVSVLPSVPLSGGLLPTRGRGPDARSAWSVLRPPPPRLVPSRSRPTSEDSSDRTQGPRKDTDATKGDRGDTTDTRRRHPASSFWEKGVGRPGSASTLTSKWFLRTHWDRSLRKGGFRST